MRQDSAGVLATTSPPGSATPNIVACADSFGARSYRINPAADLLPAPHQTLAADTV